MKRGCSILLVVTAFVAMAAAAQDKPDFTGTWALASEAPDAFTPTRIVVAKDAAVLTVTTTGQMGEFTATTLALTATSDMNGQAFEVKTVVSGGSDGTMVVETTFPDFQGGGAPMTKATYKKS